jgi:hypothetical protein
MMRNFASRNNLALGWDHWGRIHIDLDKNSVTSGFVVGPSYKDHVL